jgi:cytochrome c oxidase subunit II
MNRLNACLAASLMAASMARGGPAQMAAQATVSVIKMTAKKYEFDPNVITVKNGERVKLVITALDHDHGFKLEGLKIDEKLKRGIPTTIEFTADKVGTFPFECSHFCGIGHGKMKGKLVVNEN